MEFSGGFSGFIIIKGETQFKISEILDKIYFENDYDFKYNVLMKNFKNYRVLPLIVKIYENGVFKYHTVIFENKLLSIFRKEEFNASSIDINLSTVIGILKDQGKNKIFRDNIRESLKNCIYLPSKYWNLLESSEFNFWNLNIYNEPNIILNSKLNKEQSENIILNIKKLESYKSISQNTFILNNIIKQYNLIHNKNT